MLLRLGSIRDDPQSFVILLLALAISLLLGLTFHEFNHAIVADRLGDPGPRAAGRVSLNPLHHLDPLGTIFMFLVGFGWAKPVPVNPYRLRNGPALGMATVAAAGPISNFVLAALFALPLRFGLVDADLPRRFGILLFSQFSVSNYVALLFVYLVLINVLLGVFNLIPLAPLDGSRVAQALLPGELGRFFRQIEPYGMGILFLLFMISFLTQGQIDIIGSIVYPIQSAVIEFLLR